MRDEAPDDEPEVCVALLEAEDDDDDDDDDDDVDDDVEPRAANGEMRATGSSFFLAGTP